MVELELVGLNLVKKVIDAKAFEFKDDSDGIGSGNEVILFYLCMLFNLV